MGGFLFTPMTRFYAEALEYMKNTAGGAGNAAGAEGAGGGFAGSRNTQAGSFAGTVQDRLARKEQEAQGALPGFSGQQAAGGASRAGERNEQAVQAMSMDQYKLYIYQKISGLPASQTQRWDTVSVYISEKGFAAMKADPAYEKWVLDTLRQDFVCHNPWSAYAGGCYRVHYFGATKEEYRGESFQMGFRNDGKHTDAARKRRKKQQKSFWEKRAERHRLYMDLATKTWFRRENERKYRESIDLGRKEVSSALLRQQAMERATGEKVALGVNPNVLSEAATELAQNYVFFKIPSTPVSAKAMRGVRK
ncbi:MAG: hypothetical protein K2K90_00775 [Lachnospiraceae bacterium]|nr:hypothetical protein [Lachnospiraceae bacterium]